MNILVTGAKGFMGKNLCETIKALPEERGYRLFAIDVQDTEETLMQAASEADFVFHLAGVNRPDDPNEFQTGNADFTGKLLSLLEKGKKPPVLLSGSIQAALDNPYGKSKLAAENAVRSYGQRNETPVYLYRLPNAFGKWSRPNYNSVIATFCHNIARGLPVTVHDPSVKLHLVYIDDIVTEFLSAMEGHPNRKEDLCEVRPVYEALLSDVAEKIRSFAAMRDSLTIPDQSDGFTRKLYATYLSFLPPEDFGRTPVCHSDYRGSFTELIHMDGHGQVSLNISRPHITKGEHWHHTKHEKFIVVQGEGVIRFRKPFDSTVISYRVNGDVPTVIDIPAGYTHNIENTGDTDMLTLMWANEVFDPASPDTIRLPVAKEEQP